MQLIVPRAPSPGLALALALPLTLCVAGPTRADEVTEQIDAAKQAYTAGELQGAVDTLNFAIASIQEQIDARRLTLFPEPLPGWQADQAQAQSGGIAQVITGTNLSRRYYRPDGAEVTLSITADSPMLPMLTMFLSSPFMMQADPGTKPFAIKGQRGVIKQTDQGGVEVNLVLDNRILIQAQGEPGTGQGPAPAPPQPGEAQVQAQTPAADRSIRQAVEAYLSAMDLERVRQSFGG